jgi:filamentous hemagglutinin family protein
MLAGWVVGVESVAAQIVPDDTLGAERSRLQRDVPIRGRRGDRIEGGATRGISLFHSFSEFNVRNGERIYFANPAGISNILSRVTGSQISEILGTLGVEGSANLFLLNPNGIVFGADAQLDVRGSFLATTADRFLFPDGSSFSATAPQTPPLLTVNVPMGLQLGSQAGAIANHAHLSVPTGQSLSLIGGNIEMPGRLTAPSGQITLAAFSPNTTLSLSPTFSLLSAGTPATVRAATLLVSGQIDTSNTASGQIGGSVQLLGDQVGLLTHAGLIASGESGGGRIWVGGDYQGQGTLPRAIATYIDPTATLRADALTSGNGGQIIAWSDNSTRAYGTFSVRGGIWGGNGGLVETSSPNFLDTSGIRVDASAPAGISGIWLLDPLNVTLGYTGGVSTGGNFSGGNPNIFTPTMEGAIVNIPDIEAQLNAGTNVIITTGNTGTQEGNITANGFGINTNSAIPVSLTLQAANNIDLRNFGITANNAPLSMILQADSDGSGAGDIAVRNAGIQLRGGGFSASTPGSFLLNSAGISSDNPATAISNAQPITISANSVTIREAGINSTTSGNQSSSDITVNADTILIEQGGLGTRTIANGDAGNVTVTANTLQIRNNAGIGSSAGFTENNGQITEVFPDSQGNTGLIDITANSILVENQSGFGNDTRARGNARGINLTADQIEFFNSGLGSNTYSSGNAGQIIIIGEELLFLGDSIPANDGMGTNTFGSGNAGGIRIQGGTVLFDRFGIGSETNALINGGRGGQVLITATDAITLRSSSDISSSSNGSGNAGQVELTAPTILFEDDSGLGSVTRGSGNAGQVRVNAETLVIRDTGNSTDPNDRSGIGTNTEGTGNAGEILLNLDRLIMQNGGIGSEAKPGSSGRGGQITIEADIAIELDNSGIGSSTASGQPAGQISLQTATLQMFNSALNSNTSSSGDAGQILVNAEQATLRDSMIETRTAASGDAGSIRFTGQSLTLLQDSLIDSGTAGAGDAGSIAIRAAQAISLSDSVIATAVDRNATGQGGGIDLVTSSLSLTADALVSASTDGLGNAGNVNVTATQLAAERGGRIRTSTATESRAGNIILDIAAETRLTGDETGFFAGTDRTSSGDGGSIRLNTGRLLIQDQAAIAVNSQGTGRAGNLDIIADTARLDDRASITAETVTSSGGNIRLNLLQSLNLNNNSQISASTQDGQGGSLQINLDQTPANLVELLNGSRLTAQATGQGEAGDLTVNASTIRLEENAAIAATTTSGRDGNIVLQGDRLLVNDSEISSATTTGRAGSLIASFTDAIELSGQGGLSVAATQGGTAGNLTLMTELLSLQRGAQASVSSTARGRAGNLEVTAREVSISDRAQLTAETEAGNGGNIRLQISNELRLNNGGISASTSDGVGGDLELNVNQSPTNTLELLNNSRIVTEATGSGNAGSLILNAQIANLRGNSVISASTRSGIGGDIVLNGLSTLQMNNSQISASTRTGTAGNLSIDAVDTIQLGNGSRLTVAATRAGGAAGNINLQTGVLNLQSQAALSAETIASNTGGNINLQISESLRLGDRSRISAATRDGQGGQLSVNQNSAAIENVTLTDGSAIATEATRLGNAGRLVIHARQLTLQNGAEISASTRSGESGDITLRGLNQLTVDNSTVAASTRTGVAGSVSISATEFINLLGHGGVLVEATAAGQAGSLNLTTDDLAITEGAIASVSSPLGAAGSLTVDANTIRLDNGRLTAEAGAGRGANITLRTTERLSMNNGSQISARATDNADGGNISIDATNGFIIAVPQQNNDILASAERGNGGRIDITTQGIFGLEERNPLTPLSDINASSEFGLDGTITINRIVDPSQGLIELPADIIDASQQIAQACPREGSESIEDLGSFYVTGRGGLPPSPNSMLEAEDVITEWVDGGPTSSAQPAIGSATQLRDATVSTTVREAQGWVMSETGEIQLIAHIPNAASPLPMNLNCSESDRHQE